MPISSMCRIAIENRKLQSMLASKAAYLTGTKNKQQNLKSKGTNVLNFLDQINTQTHCSVVIISCAALVSLNSNIACFPVSPVHTE